MGLQAGSADMRPFQQAGMFTLEGIMGVTGHQRNSLTSVLHKGLH